jgi:polyhydroxyalkanoate synthase
VPVQNTAIDTALDAVRTLFGVVDVFRRVQGDAVAALGLGPRECAYRLRASAPYWRLRDYGSHKTSHSLLIIAAPIKRPYIWDLAPSTSAIRYCLREGLHVHQQVT